MTRSRASAKKAGTEFETLIAKGLAEALDDDRIERRARSGAKDRGDISGVRIHGQRLVLELKNCAKQDLPGWCREARLESGNDDALAGVVVAKRRGTTDPMEQWVHMTVRELVALITGQKPEDAA